jgi:hypothetical protein
MASIVDAPLWGVGSGGTVVPNAIRWIDISNDAALYCRRCSDAILMVSVSEFNLSSLNPSKDAELLSFWVYRFRHSPDHARKFLPAKRRLDSCLGIGIGVAIG